MSLSKYEQPLQTLKKRGHQPWAKPSHERKKGTSEATGRAGVITYSLSSATPEGTTFTVSPWVKPSHERKKG